MPTNRKREEAAAEQHADDIAPATLRWRSSRGGINGSPDASLDDGEAGEQDSGRDRHMTVRALAHPSVGAVEIV